MPLAIAGQLSSTMQLGEAENKLLLHILCSTKYPCTHIQAEPFGQPLGYKNQWCSSSMKPSPFGLKFIVSPGCEYFQVKFFFWFS